MTLYATSRHFLYYTGCDGITCMNHAARAEYLACNSTFLISSSALFSHPLLGVGFLQASLMYREQRIIITW
jgi:hypothetical protein